MAQNKQKMIYILLFKELFVLLLQQIIASDSMQTDNKVLENNHNIKTQFDYVLKQNISDLKTLSSDNSSQFDVFAENEVYAPGNEGNDGINNTFTSDTILAVHAIHDLNSWTDSSSNTSSVPSSSTTRDTTSSTQMFETTIRPNVRPNASPNARANVNDDKVQHKYYNETNETIDSTSIRTVFEHNYNFSSNSGSTDNRLKLFKHNEPEAGIRVRTPLNQINANIENSHKSWPQLAANVELDEKTNESYKSINTYGLVNENIAFVRNESTAPSTTSVPTKSSIGLTQNTDNTQRIKYIEKSVEKQNIDNNMRTSESSHTTSLTGLTDQSLNTNTYNTYRSITEISSESNVSSIDTISTQALNTQNDTTATESQSLYLAIAAGAPTQSPATHIYPEYPTTAAGVHRYWSDRNETDFVSNETESLLSLSSDDGTTTHSSPKTDPLRPILTKNSLSDTTTLSPKTNFNSNSSEQYIDIQYDDNESIASHRRCHWEQLNDVNWTSSEIGVLATQTCPQPYSGTVYRPCYSSGLWGDPDYSECRLEHLREIQSLILYHVHKHLVDGLYPLAEDLSRLVTSGRFPLRSPMDRLDAIDSLNAILRAKIKIRMEDEEKNVNLIQSLTTICDQVLTRTQVVFAIETEKNALITQKTAEALFGFRLLSENILRALIVVCDDGTIRRIKPIVPNARNIIMTLTHRTPFGSLIPLVTPSNYTTLINNTIIPKVIIHLEDFNKLGVGISSVWIRQLGSVLDNSAYEVMSDVVLVSVVPAVSIEVDFEETPKVEVELRLKRTVSANDDISCGRIRSARDLWQRKGCETIARNVSSIHCLCNEVGIIAALFHKSSSTDSTVNTSGHNHLLLVHTIVLYISFTISLLLLMISLFCQIIQRSRESCEASFILISLVSSLMAIQLTFLLGAPFAFKWTLSQHICSMVPLVFHFLHLVSAFWMLSHTVFLYQRLWRPLSRSSSSSLPFSESHQSFTPSSKCWSDWWSRTTTILFSHQWGCKQFFFFATALPALSVLVSYYLNPEGYETKRYCWMSIEGGMQYSFIVPVSVLILTNTVIMLLVLKRFFETKPLTHKTEIDKTQPALRAGVTLLPFFAVNWFLSVLALEDTVTTSFQCIFALSNTTLSYLVFLFHCYQRYDLHEYIKVRLFGAKKHQNSSLRLKKNSYPGRGLRVDIPRLCIGDDRDLTSVPIASNSGSSIDCQPLLMPYSGSSPTPNPNNYKPKELH